MTVTPAARPTHRTVGLARGADVDYDAGLRWQQRAAEAVRDGLGESLALLEHRPVYTMGRRGGRASLLVPPESLRAPVVDIDRGGDLTWHGPGQLVGYPILDLRGRGLRPADYVRTLEALLADVLGAFEVAAAPVPGRPGVWAGEAKVAAIGVSIRGGVSGHGFALNVAPDLRWYGDIVPCGLVDAGVTSMERLLGEAPAMEDVVRATCEVFEARFGCLLAEPVPGGLE